MEVDREGDVPPPALPPSALPPLAPLVDAGPNSSERIRMDPDGCYMSNEMLDTLHHDLRINTEVIPGEAP